MPNRHHYIPCWLSKGFAAPRNRYGVMYIYGIGEKEPRASTPDDWGCERGFYEDTKRQVEEKWARFEEKDHRMTERLRDAVGKVDGSYVSEIGGYVERVAGRSAELRKRLEGGVRELFEGIWTLSGNGMLEEMIAAEAGREGMIETAIRDELGKHPELEATEAQITQAAAAVREEIKEKGLGDPRPAVVGMLGHILTNIEEMIKETHNRAVEEILERNTGSRRYEGMNHWEVRLTKSKNMILGESVVIEERENRNGEGTHILNYDDSRTKAVYLPISSDRVLIGYNDAIEVRECEPWLEEQVAKTSAQEFIAREQSLRCRELQQMIGKSPESVSRENILGTLVELYEEQTGRTFDDWLRERGEKRN